MDETEQEIQHDEDMTSTWLCQSYGINEYDVVKISQLPVLHDQGEWPGVMIVFWFRKGVAGTEIVAYLERFPDLETILFQKVSVDIPTCLSNQLVTKLILRQVPEIHDYAILTTPTLNSVLINSRQTIDIDQALKMSSTPGMNFELALSLEGPEPKWTGRIDRWQGDSISIFQSHFCSRQIIVSECHNLKSLTLNTSTMPTRALLVLERGLRNLRNLRMCNVNAVMGLENCPELVLLTLYRGCFTSTRSLKGLDKCTLIKQLDFSLCTELEEIEISNLVFLKKLCLRHTKLDHLNGFEYLTELEQLDISGTPLLCRLHNRAMEGNIVSVKHETWQVTPASILKGCAYKAQELGVLNRHNVLEAVLRALQADLV